MSREVEKRKERIEPIEWTDSMFIEIRAAQNGYIIRESHYGLDGSILGGTYIERVPKEVLYRVLEFLEEHGPYYVGNEKISALYVQLRGDKEDE